MGGLNGSQVKGGAIVNDLEDARWPLVEAIETAQQLDAVLYRGAALLQKLQGLLAESQLALVRAERVRGATHFEERESTRVDGLSVRTQPRIPGERQIHRPPVRIPDEERLRIVARKNAGETLQAIGADYGVSRQRIAQIVERAQPRPSYADTKIARALVDSVRDDNERPLLDILHQLDGLRQLQANHNGHGGQQ
jgi:hypothetical protein